MPKIVEMGLIKYNRNIKKGDAGMSYFQYTTKDSYTDQACSDYTEYDALLVDDAGFIQSIHNKDKFYIELPFKTYHCTKIPELSSQIHHSDGSTGYYIYASTPEGADIQIVYGSAYGKVSIIINDPELNDVYSIDPVTKGTTDLFISVDTSIDEDGSFRINNIDQLKEFFNNIFNNIEWHTKSVGTWASKSTLTSPKIVGDVRAKGDFTGI
ncbi:MAG: hypothetical protein ACE5KE_14320 [Methanosarcinales archaeon]